MFIVKPDASAVILEGNTHQEKTFEVDDVVRRQTINRFRCYVNVLDSFMGRKFRTL
jgi:hypothetical protein